MKKARLLFIPLSALILASFIFVLFLLLGKAREFELTFQNSDGLFSGLSVRAEIYNDTDAYSLSADICAGETVPLEFKKSDRYYHHYDLPHEHESDANGLDLTYINVRKLILARDEKLVLYRLFDDTPLAISEDVNGRIYIRVYNTQEKKLTDICDLYIEKREQGTPAVDYSNGVACVKLSSALYFEGKVFWKNYYYRAVDMKTHTLAAHGDITDTPLDGVDFAFFDAFTVREVFDVLWRDGILYVIDNANCRTSGYGNISALPIISAMTKDGAVVMGKRMFFGNLVSADTQYIKISFIDGEGE